MKGSKLVYTNLFMNINNNTAPFVSLTWHQKETLGGVVYPHFPTNDSYDKCIYSSYCCLPCNYVNKPFDILQTVIKSQKVYHLGTEKYRNIFNIYIYIYIQNT